MKRFMIDIETLGTGANSAILSIGAVRFDFDSGECVDSGDRFDIDSLIENSSEKFECFIDIDESIKAGAEVDGSTILWWFDQITKGNDPYPVDYQIHNERVALESLCRFIGGNAFTDENEPKEIWCNGTDFDIVILRSAFERYGADVPWKHWEVRDMRTIVKTFDPEKKLRKVSDTKHTALGDAIDQANWLKAVVSFHVSRGTLYV